MPRNNLRLAKGVDDVIRHFILATIILFDVIIQASDLIGLSKGKSRKKLYHKNQVDLARKYLDAKEEQEIRNLLEEGEIISSLNKETLVDLILSNPELINTLIINERKASLMQMKNNELRSLLKGSDKLSRLRKDQLVDLVLLNETVGKISEE